MRHNVATKQQPGQVLLFDVPFCRYMGRSPGDGRAEARAAQGLPWIRRVPCGARTIGRAWLGRVQTISQIVPWGRNNEATSVGLTRESRSTHWTRLNAQPSMVRTLTGHCRAAVLWGPIHSDPPIHETVWRGRASVPAKTAEKEADQCPTIKEKPSILKSRR